MANFLLQASVKALRGVHFARDANRKFDISETIQQLSSDLGDVSLSDLVKSLLDAVGDGSRMQYPRELAASVNIPHEIFTQDTARLARESCSAILAWSEKHMM